MYKAIDPRVNELQIMTDIDVWTMSDVELRHKFVQEVERGRTFFGDRFNLKSPECSEYAFQIANNTKTALKLRLETPVRDSFLEPLKDACRRLSILAEYKKRFS